jgi:hypothetical protein
MRRKNDADDEADVDADVDVEADADADVDDAVDDEGASGLSISRLLSTGLASEMKHFFFSCHETV